MALAAAQVIDAVAARLSGATAAGAGVYTSRAWPLAEADLPAWRVTAEDEAAESLYVGTNTNEHTLTIECKALARAVQNLDDVLHALAAEGLAALFAAPLLHELQLVSITRALATEGEAAVGAITVSLTAKYLVDPAAPQVIL